MKKKSLLLLLLVMTFASMGSDCDDEDDPGVPNPGFGVVAVDRTGPFEKALLGAVTHGSWIRDLHPSANGSFTEWVTEGRDAGQDTVPDGRAPAGYEIFAIANWGRCTGLTGLQAIDRGVWNYVPCRIIRFPGISFLELPITPRTVDATGVPVTFEIQTVGLNTDYGMPKVQFFNEYGTLAASTYATEVSTGQNWL